MRAILAGSIVWLLILTWIVVKPAHPTVTASDFPEWWYGADSSGAAAIVSDCEERYARRDKLVESLKRLSTSPQSPEAPSAGMWRVLTTDAIASLIMELEIERLEPNKCTRAELRLLSWRRGIEP